MSICVLYVINFKSFSILVEIRWVQFEAAGNIFSILYIFFKIKIRQLSVTGLSNEKKA